MKALPSLQEAKATSMILENQKRDMKTLLLENDELKNEIAFIKGRCQEETPILKERQIPETRVRSGVMLGQSDAKMIIEEIREILSLDSDDPVLVLETVRKLEKVVKAVPRMENFITSISRNIAEEH